MTPEQLDATSIEVALKAGGKWVDGYLMLKGVVVAEKTLTPGDIDVRKCYATSRDAFHRDIVPVLKERGKWGAFVDEIFNSLAGKWEGFDKSLAVALLNITLDLEPHELCKAAIKVLGVE